MADVIKGPTRRNSYGSRVGNSFKSIFLGILLVIGSIILLAWNENNFIKQKQALQEGETVVQETTSEEINSELEGKEVHLYGETASSDEALRDSVFGIVVDDLKLARTVEMYQRYEETDEECTDNYGGSEDCTTTYTYDTDWSDDAIDSSDFEYPSGHENPSIRAYESTYQEKSPITLGVYTLDSVFTDQLTNYKTVDLSQQNITVPDKYKTASTTQTSSVEDNNNSYLYGETATNSGENIETNSDQISDSIIDYENFHIVNNYIYIGKNPDSPVVGDLKITFSSVKTGIVSIVGKQSGNELTSYKTSNGRTIQLLKYGNVSAETMFINAHNANKNMTWILRFVGLFLMFCGFSMIFKFVETIAKVIPPLANIIGVGTAIIAFALTLVIGFATIGIARLVVRPVIGIICLVIAIGGIIMLKKMKKEKKSEESKSKE